MNVHDLLESATDTTTTVDEETVLADLRRGRRALRTRRVTAALGVASVVGVAGLGVTSLVDGSVDAPDAEVAVDGIMLVAYSGDQPSGYEVELIPDGWEIQDADPYHFVVAPVGAADQDPHSYVDKILVALRSADDTGTPTGTSVDVDGQPGYLRHESIGAVLTYQDGNGAWIWVQVPPQLGWSEGDILDFAAGVTANDHAQPRQG